MSKEVMVQIVVALAVLSALFIVAIAISVFFPIELNMVAVITDIPAKELPAIIIN